MRWQRLNANILLITDADETHRQLLLESAGYSVQRVGTPSAEKHLHVGNYQLILLSSDDGIGSTLELCVRLKAIAPEARVAVIAQRSEYVPASPDIDIVIREQHSPGRFLAAVKKLVEAPRAQTFSAADGE